MQETTAGPAHGGTGSVTIADIVGLAAERYGERTAARFKRDDEWREVSYRELAETVSEIARGLVDLGLAPGRPRRPAVHDPRRVDVRGLRDHVGRRASWSRSIRPTRPTSASGSWATPSRASSICEDASQVAKIVAVRDRLPQLEQIISIEPAEGAISRRRRCASAAARATRGEIAERVAAVKPEDPVHDHLHVGDDRAAEGLRAHARQLPRRSPACARRSTSSRRASSSTSTCRSRTPTRC